MANNGPNRGRLLRAAINRFAAILIEEARALSGLSYPALDEALGLENGQSYRYSLYPRTKKTRSPQAASIQTLENRVAKLLKRRAHRLVIQNNAAIRQGQNGSGGSPATPVGLDDIAHTDLQIGYEHDWPTFRRLKGRLVMEHYLWQWGILWDTGRLPYPWSRELFGIPADMPVEAFLPALTMAHVHLRRDAVTQLAAGNLPESPSYQETLALARSYGFPC